MFELTFMTSSNVKREHAKYLCSPFNFMIKKQNYYGKAYDEPRIFEREDLLEQSIDDAQNRWKKSTANSDKKLFFIEDTSVIVHILSSPNNEVPGVDVKYWMRENNFKSIDAELKVKGNDRRVTVRSDLILVLTAQLSKKYNKKYMRFSSETYGTISEKEYDFTTNPIYPWLDNKTFNKWFVPDGSTLPISMLDIQDANKYDFRKGAFMQMLEFIEKNEEYQENKEHRKQSSLAIDPPLFLVSGPTCAGKTTLADHLVSQYGYYHIEASDFMYLSYHRKLGIGSQISISSYARKALESDPDIVVNEILSFLTSRKGLPPLIITGLRTPEEIESFKIKYIGPQSIRIVTVSANKELRLERYLERNRGGKTSPEKFHIDCTIQDEMGLDRLMNSYNDDLYINEETQNVFFDEFCEEFKAELINLTPLILEPIYTLKPNALEDAILMSLTKISDYLTTTEIAHQINKIFKHHNIEKSKNNVSRYFNQYFSPFYEAINVDGVNKYRLSQTGIMHAKYLMKTSSNSISLNQGGK